MKRLLAVLGLVALATFSFYSDSAFGQCGSGGSRQAQVQQQQPPAVFSFNQPQEQFQPVNIQPTQRQVQRERNDQLTAVIQERDHLKHQLTNMEQRLNRIVEHLETGGAGVTDSDYATEEQLAGPFRRKGGKRGGGCGAGGCDENEATVVPTLARDPGVHLLTQLRRATVNPATAHLATRE